MILFLSVFGVVTGSITMKNAKKAGGPANKESVRTKFPLKLSRIAKSTRYGRRKPNAVVQRLIMITKIRPTIKVMMPAAPHHAEKIGRKNELTTMANAAGLKMFLCL